MPSHDAKAASPLADADEVERRIVCAYVQLALMLDRSDQPRSVTIARFGTIEVRLTEMPRDGSPPETPPFWLEMHSYASGSTIDSCGCLEFDEDEPATCVALIRSADYRALAECKANRPRPRHAGLHDGLTAVPTRTLFRKRFAEALPHPAQAGGKAGLLLLDIGGFREINAALVYDAGGAVLRMVADLLRASARPGMWWPGTAATSSPSSCPNCGTWRPRARGSLPGYGSLSPVTASLSSAGPASGRASGLEPTIAHGGDIIVSAAKACSPLETVLQRKSVAQQDDDSLRKLFQQAPGFVAVLRGPDHVFEIINSAYQQHVGPRELIGRPLREAVPEAVEQGFLDLLDQVYTSGTPYVGKAVPLTLHSQPETEPVTSYVDFVYQPITADDGSVTGIFVQGQDVTGQKLATEALLEGERRYRALIEASTALVWRAGPDGSVISGSPEWRVLSGQRPGDSQGNGWLNAVHSDDRERVMAVWQEAITSRQSLRTEYRVGNPNADYRWVLAKGVPLLDADGAVQEWVGTLTDVHEQKLAAERLRNSEARYRALVTATSSIFWQAAPDGSITDFAGFDDHPGPQEDLLGFGWLSLVHPGDRDRLIAEWQAIVASGESGESEFRFSGATDEYRWVCCRAVPLKDDAGVVREWVGTLSDIHDRKEAEIQLILRERSLEAIGQGVLITDPRQPDNPIIYSNAAFERLTGYGAREVIGRNCRFLQGAGTDVQAVRRIRSALQAGKTTRETLVNFRKDGTTFINELTISPVRDSDGHITHFVGIQSDITERQRLKERLQLSLKAGRMVAWEQDLATNYISRSQTSLALLGIGSGPLSEFLTRVHPEDRTLLEKLSDQVVREGSGTTEFRYFLPTGRMMWLGARAEKAGPDSIVGVAFDITDRKAAEEEIWRTANHDPLTGLPNRALFQDRFEQALAGAKKNGTSVTLLLIDLDNFKDINDTLGHDAGDALLKEAATRLKTVIRECDTVARLGGDEFAVVLVEPLRLEHAARFADVVIEMLREPFVYEGRALVGGASIGVAAFPDHDSNPAELIRDADIALYRAKAAGRNRAVTYSPSMRREIEERVTLARDVREAISKAQVIPYYQPKVSLSTGRIVGFEALARWQHPSKGILTPDHFSLVFDDHELATAMGQHLITRVVMDMREWLDAALNIGRVAVNLSSAECTEPGGADEILHTLNLMRVPTEHFEVEVTETVLLGRGSGSVAAILERFHQQGVRIALDDFGTGYASLTHLKQFPVDHIKIDRTFVADLGQGKGDAIVAAVLGLGKSLNLQLTAEGVETIDQAQRLREMGCHDAQGYLYAKPMAAAQVAPFLASFEPRHVIRHVTDD
jgi:diguanylate cyclase (GGDEF)-like protein/PAS domain S-box-containing protein